MYKAHRIESIDLLKTISIFGVVFIHSRNGNVISETVSEFFRVSVPIFIIFFAYFLEKALSNVSSKQEYYSVLKQKFYVLFLPYAFFTVLYFFLFNDLSAITIQELATGYWSGYGWSGQYFFIILFQLVLFFPFLQKLANIKISYMIIFSLFLYFIMSYIFWDSSIISKISDRIFIYWIPYTLLGILLYRNINLFRNFTNKLILLPIILIPIEFFIFDYLKIDHSPYVLLSVLVSSCFVTIYFIVNQNTIKNYLPEKINNLSIYISKRTLGIFVLNPLVIFLLKPYFDMVRSHNNFTDSVFVFIFALTTFLLCLFIIEILSKTIIRKLVVN